MINSAETLPPTDFTVLALFATVISTSTPFCHVSTVTTALLPSTMGVTFIPRSAVAAKLKVNFGDNELYCAAKTAIEGKIGFLGINSVVFGIIDGDADKVFIFQMICHIRTEY